MKERAAQLREKILDMVAEFHDAEFPQRAFVPGETPVPVSGKVFDAEDIRKLVDASLDFWLTTGRDVYHFHTRTKTGRCPDLQAAAPEPFVQIARADADTASPVAAN